MRSNLWIDGEKAASHKAQLFWYMVIILFAVAAYLITEVVTDWVAMSV